MRKAIPFLDSTEYEHEFDRKAINILKDFPGIETLTSTFVKYFASKPFRIQLTGSNIKITSSNFPEIYEIVTEVCDTLGVDNIPDVYLSPNWWINAYTVGSNTEHLVCIESGSLEMLTRDELLYIIGHEIGHIKSGHVLYHTMGQYLPALGEIIGTLTFGIGSVVSKGIDLALYRWVRMSELTADRAGLLACQDLEVAMRVNMKMAGIPKTHYDRINTAEFIKQAKEFEAYDFNSIDSIIKILHILNQTHPWTVMRAAELLKWVESGNYDRVLNRTSKNNVTTDSDCSEIVFCRNCGTKLFTDMLFCPNCGTKKIE